MFLTLLQFQMYVFGPNVPFRIAHSASQRGKLRRPLNYAEYILISLDSSGWDYVVGDSTSSAISPFGILVYRLVGRVRRKFPPHRKDLPPCGNGHDPTDHARKSPWNCASFLYFDDGVPIGPIRGTRLRHIACSWGAGG